jgi:predicted phosphodiesterase
MSVAIISDVHANLEALQAVLQDIKKQGASEIISLGDVIGYGPNPRECLQLIKDNCKISLMGNHEDAVLFLSVNFKKEAAEAVNWTRSQLNSPEYDENKTKELWDYLGELPKSKLVKNTLYVHGSPFQPINEYIYPSDADNPEKMHDNFSKVKSICFCGHTHEPGIFVQAPDQFVKFYEPAKINNTYYFDENKCIVNVGSVGQPRDNDNRACYIIIKNDVLQFRRVQYDIKETIKKILDVKLLPRIFAARLQVGK